MYKKGLFLGVIVIAIVIVAVYTNQTNTIIRLKGIEVRKYKGENLSSIYDFRENSIKGPQYIDNESYRLIISGLVENFLELEYDKITTKYQRYEKVVTLYCVEGWDVTILWEGILIKDLLEEAKVNTQAKIVIFYAKNIYKCNDEFILVRSKKSLELK